MAPEEQRQENLSDTPSRSHLWGIALGLAVLLGVYVAASITLQTLFDAEYLENKANEALDATDGPYQLSVDTVDWTLLLHAVEVEQVTLQPDSQTLQRQRKAEAASPLVRATLPAVRIQGIHVWDLLWHGTPRLHTVAVRHPQVHLDATNLPETPRADTSFDRSMLSVHAALARSLPDGEVRHLIIEDGTASYARSAAPSLPPDSLWGLSLQMRDIVLDSTAARDPSRVLFSTDIDLAFNGVRHLSSDSLYVYRLGSGRVSGPPTSLTVNDLELTPTVPDETFMRRHQYRANRFDTAVRQITLDSFELRQFIEERALRAHTLELDSLVLDVYRDNHLPPHPDAPLPKTMPHEAVRNLDRALRIDTVRISNAYAAYTKRDEDASEPGTITFEDLWATIYNVTNDPDRMSPESPAVVDARTQVAGVGQLHTTIHLPLLTPHLSLSYEGQLGPMDARAFNMAFVDLSGVRIQSGQVDSLWFEADVQQGTATGVVQGIYRNLDIEMVDQQSREQDLPARIKTLVVDDIALEPNNIPEESPLRTGEIDYEYEEGTTFLKFLWHSVRSGLYSLVGL